MIKSYACIICPKGCEITIKTEGTQPISIEGANCNRGMEYVKQELTDPQRTIATLVAVQNGETPLVSVRLTKAIPKAKIFDVVAEIKTVKLTAPVTLGQVVLKNVLGLDSDVISTKNVPAIAGS